MLPRWFSMTFNLFYKDELHVHIGSQSIELWRLKSVIGFKPQLLQHEVIKLSDVAHSPDDWHGVLGQLQTLLKDNKWQAPTATVTLSSHFMRYAVIPWNSEITTSEEQQSYLKHRFTMGYGDAVKSWNMRMDAPKYKKAALASAMPDGLQVALSDTLAQANSRLDALYPYLMQAANHVFETKNFTGDCWLAVVENQRLGLSLIEDGEWQVVRNLPLEVDVAVQIETLIQRETMLENVSIHTSESRKRYQVLIHWPSSGELKSIEIQHRRVVGVVCNQHLASRPASAQQSMDWATR